MFRRIMRIGLLAIALSTVVTACKSSDDSVFEDSPYNREKEQSKKLQTALLDSEFGWRFTYFPDNSGIGGFTFLMKFNDQGQVEMVSDFTDEGYTKKVSEYETQLRSTTSLVFTTNTYIHELSDPINSALRTGRGFEGEFQFRFYGSDENNIFFRGTKDSNKEFTFVKATADDWNSFADRKVAMAEIGNPDVAVFRSIAINQGGTVKKYDAMFTNALRFMTLNEGVDQDLMPRKSGFGIGYTKEGISIQPAIEIEGEKFSDFKWNASQKAFVSINSSTTSVSIRNVEEPSIWSKEYETFFFSNQSNTVAFIKENLMNAPGNSQKFLDAVGGVDFTRIYITGSKGKVTIKYMVGIIKGYSFTYDAVDVGTHIKLTNGTKGKLIPKEFLELHDKLFGTGVIYLKSQSYNIAYSNPIFTIYSGPITFDTYRL